MDSVSTLEIWQIFFTRLWPVWAALAVTFFVLYQMRKKLGTLGQIFDSRVGLVGLFIVLFWIYAAIFADLIALFEPLEQSGLYRRKPPGTINSNVGIPYIFGTDTLGRDLFSRMIYGSQIVLLIAPAATLVAYIVGITLGLPAGYIGGFYDTALSFLANLVLAFPVILLFYLLVAPGIRETILPNIMAGIFFIIPVLFALMVIFSRFSQRLSVLVPSTIVILIIGAWLYSGLVFNADPLGLVAIDPNELNIFAAVVFTTSPGVFRIVRGLTLDIRTRDYVAAAVTRGENPLFIMIWEILPNARGPLIVDSCLRIGYVTILLGTLGFFGLGMEPESPDWGSMINQTRSYIRLVPTIVLPPTIALASFVLGLNLLADGLREQSLKD
tara:strand:- start:1304 stop:2455 length:1152 start_codon:yes stop_codon:yes gene_type:complete